MIEQEPEKRLVSRKSLNFSVVVKGRESDDVFWKEVSEITNVSRLGASFSLSRECATGQIVSLMMKMPKYLRSYDLDKKLYRIWGLIQYCSPVKRGEKVEYQIGVAFIGKHAPQSYINNPLNTYRVSGVDSEGFWKIGEAKTPFVTRSFHRFSRAFKARIAVIDENGEEIKVDAEAVTENISEGGTAVFSTLDLNTGDCVRFTCQEYKFSSICVVRNQQRWENNLSILHLEFSDARFPIRKIILSSDDYDELETDEESVAEPQIEASMIEEDTAFNDPTNTEDIEVNDEDIEDDEQLNYGDIEFNDRANNENIELNDSLTGEHTDNNTPLTDQDIEYNDPINNEDT
jgi:hypothetical protein